MGAVLAFVQAPAIGIVALVWTALLIFAAGYSLGEILLLAQHKQPLWKRIALYPLNVISRKLNSILRRVVATASHEFTRLAPMGAHVLHDRAATISHLSVAVAATPQATYKALYTLRHTTIPTLIARATDKLEARLDIHTDRLDQLEDLNRRIAVAVGDTLRALPWGVPGGLVTNWQTFLDRFVQLWNHYWDVTREQLTTLLGETLPEIRTDIADLARRLDVNIDARLDALANRIGDLERQAAGVILPRLQSLEDAVAAISVDVYGQAGEGLVDLFGRVAELERRLDVDVPALFAALQADVDQLRLDLTTGIAAGLEAFTDRLEALETFATETVPAELQALRLAVDTLATEVFTEVGAGLSDLTARIVALEAQIQGVILPGFDAIIGRIETLESSLRDDVLPRVRALEALLAPAALAAAVLAALRIAAPNLFCRNVTNATRRVCSLDGNDFSALMNALMLAGIIGNLEWYVRGCQEIMGVSTGLVYAALDPENRSEVASEGDVTTEPIVEPGEGALGGPVPVGA